MAELHVAGLVRRFGGVDVLRGIDLRVADGEFVSLLGPSGCGKSTTLSLIAGLDRPDGGSVRIGERTVADAALGVFVLPERRGLGLVPQSYALWPHMTVRDNVGFPLEVRGLGRAARARRVGECLDLVEIAALAGRYPYELSGGQQQRVALARALAHEPAVLLLDEPLSNVDAKLRERARLWLRQLQRRTRLTTVFVTHDQAEALTMSDRVAVMSGGAIVQFADPVTVYARPATAFVADFIGSSNLLCGRVAAATGDGRVWIDIGLPDPVEVASSLDAVPGRPVQLAVRAEQIGPADAAGAGNRLPFNLEQSDYVGGHWLHHGHVAGQPVRFRAGTPAVPPGTQLTFAPEHGLLFPGAGPE